MVQAASLLLGVLLTVSGTGGEKNADPGVYVIDAGKIVTMDAEDRVLNNARAIVADGKIVAVGTRTEIDVPDNATVIDAKDKWLVPGMVDAHNHSGASIWDLNDSVYLTNLGLRTLDVVEPDIDYIKTARAGGVTAVLVIPGSGTNMSGFGTLVQTGGSTLDDVLIRYPGSLKIAQAGNPEWYWYGVGRSFMNYNTRQTMLKAKAYHEALEKFESGETSEKPQFNPMFHDFRGLFRREFPVLVHTQIYQVLMTTLDMLAKKLGLWTILGHCTFDAYKLAPLVDETRTFTINGPRQYHFDRQERKMNGHAARWWQGGVRKLGVNTDSVFATSIAQEELSYQATMACWYGWLPYPALRGVTRIPAEALGMLDHAGTIEPGKNADLGIWTGDPIDPRSSCELTFVKGKIVYDASVKRRF